MIKKIYINNEILESLKKDSTNYLDKEINLLVKNISTVLNKDKIFIQKYVELIRNFGIFNNYNSDLSLNNKEENKETNKEKIKKREKINEERLDYLKKFYINKFKKYLSTIKNDNTKMNSNINLTFIGNDEIEIELQNEIYNENKKLFPFLVEDVKKYFINITPEYNNEIINSINGINDIYDSKYEKIKEYSNFNFNDAANVVLYILISELNKLIKCSIVDESNDNNDDENINIQELYSKNSSNTKCKYICLFILLLLEDLENDIELFVNCNEGVEQIKNSLIHDIINYKSKVYFSEDNDYISKMMKDSFYTKSMIVNELEENIQETVDIQNLESKYNEQSEKAIQKGKEYYLKKYGYLPNDDVLETYKSEYLDNMQDEKNIEEEIYDIVDSTPKGDEVIDQGAEYGGFTEYAFEDGDGFDYSKEAYE